LLLAEAKRSRAHLYSVQEYLAAEASYDSAMVSWKLENERLIFRRDYRPAAQYALKASRLARLAIERTGRVSVDLDGKIENELDTVRQMLEEYNRYYAGLPVQAELGAGIARARQALQEGIAAVQNGQQAVALDRVMIAGEIVAEVNSRGKEILGSYFTGYPHWQISVQKALDRSKASGKNCILVDKYSRRCILVRHGSPRDTFGVELGPNWMGQKNHQGDRSTPEGNYRVKSMKSGNATRYFKALLLDYPNEQDTRRFQERKKSGEYGPGVHIGGMIEIHGHGGKGSDWTEGCIALNNEDMDILFRHTRVGMEVIIVGSIRPLEEILR